MLRLRAVLIFLFIALIIPARGSAYDLARNVTEFRLANGMRWLLVRRTQAPVFSGVVMVRVGGADEEPGKTGLAHLFEHMAFKGSYRIGTKDWAKEKPLLDRIERLGAEVTAEMKKEKPDAARAKELAAEIAKLEHEADAYRVKNEIWEIMSRNGASDLNAFTSKDVTAYHASLPANKLELWARIMAEMAFEPSFREFYTERNVVAEERLSSLENNPDGAMGERLLSASYETGPYKWTTIGYKQDIMGLTIADARAFHARNYVPGNMVGVLVGDLDPKAVKPVLERAFGAYGAKPMPPEPVVKEIDSGGVKEDFKFKAQPSLAVAWHKPTLPDKAEYAFDIIESLLCGGRSSRLEKDLVFDHRLAEDISCTVSYPGSRLSNLFLIWIEPMKSVSMDRVLDSVDREIKKLAEVPVDGDELARVKKRVTSSLVFGLESNIDLARQLAEFETVFGDWRLLADYPASIAAVTPDDIMRAAQRYLNDKNRIVIERQKDR